ncbi:esterase-like activity of phytase family protein [Siccirubricoccus sp. KC 17139]|uniref:5'-nucleotidase n=1 Tax=Siccirubricoccus soli TaxID=2899147 RepID=A0ABT1DB90_9PROT|nr:esterase-like activity of phytase family protein [Siccirubricoccus soli]MCO6419193.1 esterase-like activity of phytase family protein [Siccirubricoccus soli]MCP2685328.1 esterase-like activity of phytase family protein [Siccirubricoccus soli]
MSLNILLTNDDGYDSPGLIALYDALKAAGENVHIVAPAANQSAQGSSLGGPTAFDEPFAVTEFSPGNYAVDGRPVTATLVGLDVLDLFGGEAPDIVISGTNRGDNTGESENISGTVNAAVAALQRSIPAIALSAGSEDGSYDAAFANSAEFLVSLLDKLEAARPEGGALIPGGEGLSINIPGTADPLGLAITRIDQESSAGYPIGEKPNGLYNSTFTPNTDPSGNPISEGSQFLEGRVTLSPIDGNWTASEQQRLALEDRLDGKLGDWDRPEAQPLKVMLVNEEGADAPGLELLRETLLDLGYEVTVVAPASAQDGLGTALTLTDFAVEHTADGYAVAATPSTTVYTGLDALLTGEARPDLIVSGIDGGPSLGHEGVTSGTLAAAVAGVFNYGVPSIAVSTEVDSSHGTDWCSLWHASQITADLILELQATAGADGMLLPTGVGLNVNIPRYADPSDVVFTRIDAATDHELHAAGTGTAGEAKLEFGGPVVTDDPLAEGNAFAAGHITVTPIDANYGAQEFGAYDFIGDLLGVQFGRPTSTGLFPGEARVGGIEFLGESDIGFGHGFGGLQIGGLSAITWDAATGQYYALSDDRSTDARFFTLDIGLEDGALSQGDIAFKGVHRLGQEDGQHFPANSLDPEGLALAPDGTLYLSFEGDASQLVPPLVAQFDLTGQRIAELPVDGKFTPTADESSGIRNNLAFEGLAVTPDGKTLFVGTEDALYQDGPNATVNAGSPTRILAYDTAAGHETAEYAYLTDPIAHAPVPGDAFATNGLVELLALDNQGTMLALERSFSTGIAGNDIRLYMVRTEDATDVSGLPALDGQDYIPAQKTLLLDLDDLGITLDNIEGMTFGPDLADGRKSLVMVADDNFSDTQVTQFLAFALDVKTGSADLL